MRLTCIALLGYRDLLTCKDHRDARPHLPPIFVPAVQHDCWAEPLTRPFTIDRRNMRSGRRYRANVALRTLAGTVGAYGVAALAAAALARTIPLARVDAVMIATMTAYLVAPSVTIWAFLAQGPWRAVAGVAIMLVLLGGVTWMAGPPA